MIVLHTHFLTIIKTVVFVKTSLMAVLSAANQMNLSVPSVLTECLSINLMIAQPIVSKTAKSRVMDST